MITAIIQARTGSTRLPNKVLLPLMGKPMLAHVIERVQASQKVDQIILATTTHESDDALAGLADSLGVACYRGSENDVLDRYYQAAKLHQASVVVRITGDCPVIDPAVIDRTIGLFQSDNYAYVNNFLHRTYPDGLDTEVFTFAALETAWQEANLPSEREHVTPYLYKHPEKFPQAGLVQAPDLSHFRWTVDEPVDFEFIQAVYAGLYAQNPLFDMHAITAFLEQNPELVKLNQAIPTNEGYEKSLIKDRKYLDQLIGILSNELRTPLSASMGYAKLLSLAMKEQYSISQKEQLEMAQEIDNLMNGLLNLLEDLLVNDSSDLGERIRDKDYYGTFSQNQRENYKKALRKQDVINETSLWLVHLIANSSFELRTPLVSIRGFSDILLMEKNLTDEQKSWINTMKSNAEWLWKNITDIMIDARTIVQNSKNV